MALKDVSAMSQRSGFVVLSRREESGVASGWSGWLTAGNLGPIREPQQTSEVSEDFGCFRIGSDSIPRNSLLDGSLPHGPRLGIVTVTDRIFVEACRPRWAACSLLKYVAWTPRPSESQLESDG